MIRKSKPLRIIIPLTILLAAVAFFLFSGNTFTPHPTTHVVDFSDSPAGEFLPTFMEIINTHNKNLNGGSSHE